MTPVKLASLDLGSSAALLILVGCTPLRKVKCEQKRVWNPSPVWSCIYMHIFIYLYIARRDYEGLTGIHIFPQ